MRDFDWNNALHLPDAALAADRRIPKTVLARQAQLTKAEQKVLNRIGALTHYATVQKSTTRIPPTVNEKHDIQSVVFLRCEMAQSPAYTSTAHLLHKCFPNPTVILFGSTNKVCVSVAITRRSLAEQGSTVVDAVESTGAFEPDDCAYTPFLNALAFDRLPQMDLLTYLHGLAWIVRLARMVPSLGYYPTCAESDWELLDELAAQRDALTMRVAHVQQQRRDRNLTLNESAKLHMELRALEKELGAVTDSIKEVCNG